MGEETDVGGLDAPPQTAREPVKNPARGIVGRAGYLFDQELSGCRVQQDEISVRAAHINAETIAGRVRHSPPQDAHVDGNASAGPHDERVDLDIAYFCAMIEIETPEGEHGRNERVAIRGKRSAKACQQL